MSLKCNRESPTHIATFSSPFPLILPMFHCAVISEITVSTFLDAFRTRLRLILAAVNYVFFLRAQLLKRMSMKCCSLARVWPGFVQALTYYKATNQD